jgi:hypothetical protein
MYYVEVFCAPRSRNVLLFLYFFLYYRGLFLTCDSPASLSDGSGCWIKMIRMSVLWRQTSHLLPILTKLGYGTVLTAACALQGCSHWLLLLLLLLSRIAVWTYKRVTRVLISCGTSVSPRYLQNTRVFSVHMQPLGMRSRSYNNNYYNIINR